MVIELKTRQLNSNKFNIAIIIFNTTFWLYPEHHLLIFKLYSVKLNLT